MITGVVAMKAATIVFVLVQCNIIFPVKDVAVQKIDGSGRPMLDDRGRPEYEANPAFLTNSRWQLAINIGAAALLLAGALIFIWGREAARKAGEVKDSPVGPTGEPGPPADRH